MYRTKKRLKTALCNGVKNRGKEQAEKKADLLYPEPISERACSSVLYTASGGNRSVRPMNPQGETESPKVEVELKKRPMKRKM